jgi:hypothetical protein
VGARTDAARADVVAARERLDSELVLLEASTRAAVDIPAKVRRNPVKTAGIAAGAGFVVLGGPQRLFRRAKRAVLGPPDPLPKSLLPEDIEKELRKLGDDGEKVRRILEHEFVKYLDATADERKKRELGAITTVLIVAVARPLAQRLGRLAVEQLFNPDAAGFQEAFKKVQERRADTIAGSSSGTAAAGSGPTKQGRAGR